MKPAVTYAEDGTEIISAPVVVEGEVQMVKFDEESPLLETPNITDPSGNVKQGLTVED